MPAPTALRKAIESLAIHETTHDVPEMAPEDYVIVTNVTDDWIPADIDMETPEDSGALFSPETPSKLAHSIEGRKVPVPQNRRSPLKNQWEEIRLLLVRDLKLQVRMNIAKQVVELKTSSYTTDMGAIQKGADFIQAFCLGFDLDDAVALLRVEDLYIQSFDVKDAKLLQGGHLNRAIGRVAGRHGKIKFAIETASTTRVVLAGKKLHILGNPDNIKVAMKAVVSLIQGSQPGKIYGRLRKVARRRKERS